MSYSIEEAVTDFKKKSGPGPVRGLVKAARRAALTLSIAGLVTAALGGGYIRDTQITHQEEVAQASLPEVFPEWSSASGERWGQPVGIRNHIIDTSMKSITNLSLDHGTKRTYPTDWRVVYAQPGDRLSIRVDSHFNPFKYKHKYFGAPWFEGAISLEGFDVERFSIQPARFGDAGMSEAGTEFVNYTVPEDLPSGSYPLTMDIFSLTAEELAQQKERSFSSNFMELSMPGDGRSMDRETVTVVVGEPEQTVNLNDFEPAGIPPHTSFYDPTVEGGMLDKPLNFEVDIMGEEYSFEGRMAGSAHSSLGLPHDKAERKRIISFSARPDGADWPSFIRYLPLDRICVNCEPLEDIKEELFTNFVLMNGSEAASSYTDEAVEKDAMEKQREDGSFRWILAPVTRNFPDKLIELRRQQFGYLPSEVER